MTTAKEKFRKRDRVIRGITEDGFFKVAAAKTTDVVKEAQERHDLSLLATVILGRALTAAMLLAADLKGEERVQLRMEGNGPLKLVVAEANRVGEIRGYVGRPDAELDYSKAKGLGDGLGVGLLTFTKTLFEEAKPVSGTVQLIRGDVNDDVAYYLLKSEQIPSAIRTDVELDDEGRVLSAGGILVQALPKAPLPKVEQVEKNFQSLTHIAKMFTEDKYIDDLMKMAVAPEPVKELIRVPIQFFCRCNKDRFKRALLTLGLDELKEMRGEEQRLTCRYCNKTYLFPPEEIDELIHSLE